MLKQDNKINESLPPGGRGTAIAVVGECDKKQNSLLQTCKKYDIIEKNTAFNQTEVYYAQKANHRPDVRF